MSRDVSPEMERWFRRAKRELFPRLRDSAVFLSVVGPDDASPDPKFCLELGMAIMLDKPIIALVARGRTLPQDSHLFRVADEVITDVEIGDPVAADRIQEAVHRLLAERGLLE